MHITLSFLGEQPEDRLEDAHYAFAALHAEPFEIELAGVDTFGSAGPRNVWVGVTPSAGLDHLQRKVETAARGTGIALAARRFVPHVTLARMRPHEVEMIRLEHAIVACAGFRAGPFAVTRFALMRSHLGRKGADYAPLATYELSRRD